MVDGQLSTAAGTHEGRPEATSSPSADEDGVELAVIASVEVVDRTLAPTILELIDERPPLDVRRVLVANVHIGLRVHAHSSCTDTLPRRMTRERGRN